MLDYVQSAENRIRLMARLPNGSFQAVQDEIEKVVARVQSVLSRVRALSQQQYDREE